MKHLHYLALSCITICAHAGTTASSKMCQPMAEIDTFGQITIGGKFSEDLQSGYADIITGLARTKNAALFVNLRGTFGDNDQELFSAGLGFRYLIEDAGLIIGANVYYDQIESAAGNTFQQLGLGAEILSKWVDARFNYYIPEDGQQTTGSFTRRSSSRRVTEQFANGNLFQRSVVDRTVVNRFNTVEEGLQGWNAEVGVLLPWLEQLCEFRVFAGAYSYDNPIGGDFTGFRGRAEARITQGITLDVEYWDDANLVGGNWVGGVRVSVPFDFSELCSGRNPFAGAGEIFAPHKASSLASRMDEMVMRSHRIMTTPGPVQSGSQTTTTTIKNITTGVKPPAPIPVVAPPRTDTGGGEGGGGKGQPQ